MKRAVGFASLLLGACASVPPPAATSCRERFERRTLADVRPGSTDELVFREEVFDVARAQWFDDFLAGGKNLERFLPGTNQVPGVDHDEDLTSPGFPAVGSKRVVYLRDGSTAFEEVLTLEPQHLRYLVTNSDTPGAEPILYGVGDFRFAALDENTTRVTWRYAFKLRDDRLPGSLGSLGVRLFRSSFLDTRYADFMRSGAVAMQRWAVRDGR
ncbi:MAG: hypothetical protein GQE15_29570 [Archangiaceae bacterium]|nr:hypothetical protein [Archangiaceae bacterium]